MLGHDRRGWGVPPGGMSRREGLGILTGFPLAVWQSKLPPAGRNAMSQNLMAQIAFLIRWPPPVLKAKTYRRPSPSSDMLGPPALRPAVGSKIANDGSAREPLIKYPTLFLSTYLQARPAEHAYPGLIYLTTL